MAETQRPEERMETSLDSETKQRLTPAVSEAKKKLAPNPHI
jgi:hypothetical protein